MRHSQLVATPERLIQPASVSAGSSIVERSGPNTPGIADLAGDIVVHGTPRRRGLQDRGRSAERGRLPRAALISLDTG